ncbi:MAG: demethylmenaquinone methyltransferase [Bacillota bacterium]
MKLPMSYQNRPKEEYVHSIFSQIAGKYDWMNTVMTLNRDKYWRRFAVEQAKLSEGSHSLDVCCGTGMLSLEQAKVVGANGLVIGLDFCENMLAEAEKNFKNHPLKSRIQLVYGNAMEIPYLDNTFDSVTIGFALRNVPNIEVVLREMMRVVKPGGKVVSLELAKPTAFIFKQLFWLYFEKLVPLLGKIKAKAKNPYSYLPYSVKIFPAQEEIKNLFAEIGLDEATYYNLTGGIVAVHVGTKPSC